LFTQEYAFRVEQAGIVISGRMLNAVTLSIGRAATYNTKIQQAMVYNVQRMLDLMQGYGIQPCVKTHNIVIFALAKGGELTVMEVSAHGHVCTQ
jgi:hypothetical protein